MTSIVQHVIMQIGTVSIVQDIAAIFRENLHISSNFDEHSKYQSFV